MDTTKRSAKRRVGTSAFLRGFADAGGITLKEAASRWESFALSLGDKERAEVEDRGYADGAYCGLTYAYP